MSTVPGDDNATQTVTRSRSTRRRIGPARMSVGCTTSPALDLGSGVHRSRSGRIDESTRSAEPVCPCLHLRRSRRCGDAATRSPRPRVAVPRAKRYVAGGDVQLGGHAMARAGSILGNAVQRLEDPTLLTGAGKYVDDLSSRTAWLTSCSSDRTVAHGNDRLGRRRRGGGDARRGRRVPRRRATTSAWPSLQRFPMMPADAEPADLRQGQGALRRRHRRRRRGRDRGPRPSTPPSAVVVDYDPLPVGHDAGGGAGARRARSSSPSTARTSASRTDVRRRRRRARGRRRGRRGHDGEPAPRRRADGDQRHPRRARRADGGLTCGSRTRRRTPSTRRWRPMLGLEPEQLRVVCPWVGGGFGPKAAVVRRAPGRRGRGARRSAGPVKWIETRSEDMVSLVHGRDYVMTAKLGVDADGKIVGLDATVVAVGRRLPGDRRDPADAHPDDVGRRLRHPEGALRRRRR